MTLAGDDLELFARSVESAVLAADDVDAALVDVGWFDALADDPRPAVSLLFEAQGRANATSSALDAVMATAAGLPVGTAFELPGKRLGPGVERAERATRDGRTTVPAAELPVEPVGGIDPELGLRRLARSGSGGGGDLPAHVVAAGRLALSHELIGASRAMLELARVHATERVQFDRPIGGFQAVRHKLAETLVAIEGANDAANAAWELATPTAATAAKALAGRAARTSAKHCQQVLAGIGFTLEHPFHRHLRRALVLDRLLGDSKTLTRELGEQLLRDRQVPPMLQL